MCNVIDSSAKVNAGSVSAKNITTITGELALQMLNEGNIKQESFQISDKGIATFQDQNGNSFRSELSKEQINLFQTNTATNSCNPVPEKAENASVNPENISLLTKVPAGSAKTSASLFDEIDDKNTVPDIKTKSNSKVKDDQWKFNVSMGFNRTHYYDTDMHLKDSRMDVTIKDFAFKERTSADFYNPKNWKQPMDAGRWIDEPTNAFTVSATKNNNVFSLTAFHPKFLKEDYETKMVTGTVDGVHVNQVMPINEPFDGYNDQPGQMHLTRFENTYRQMDWQAGFGRNINLIDSKYGKVVYTPSIYLGITTGQHVDIYNKPGAYWDYDENDDKLKIQGANVAIGNRLKYEYGRANIFVENKFTFSHLKTGFQDGSAEFNMKYNATTFGLGFQLNKNKTKPKDPTATE